MSPSLRRPLTFLALAACFVATVATSPAPPRWSTQTRLEGEPVVLTAENPRQTRTVAFHTTPARHPADELVFIGKNAQFTPEWEPSAASPDELPWIELSIRSLSSESDAVATELVRVNADGSISPVTLYFPYDGLCRDSEACEERFTVTFERDPNSSGTITLPWVLDGSASGANDSAHDEVPEGFTIRFVIEE